MSNSMRAEIPSLTAIRGFAALWIVVHHIQPTWWPNVGPVPSALMSMGYTAVDIFFVLSGFILSDVYRDLTLSRVGQFWLRRVLRIYPVTLCVLAPLAFSHVRREGVDAWWGLLVNLSNLQGVVPNTGMVWNPPTWSVGVELCCYVMFPLLIVLPRRLGSIPIALGVIPVACIEAWAVTRYLGDIAAPGSLVRGLAGFAFGGWVTFLPQRRTPWAAASMEVIGATSIAAGVLWATPALVPLGAAGLILALRGEQGPMARALSYRVPVWLGTVSFSTYVLHAPLIAVVGKYAGDQLGAWTGAVVLLAVLPLSEVTYRWIELPGRRLGRRLTASRPNLQNPTSLEIGVTAPTG